MIDFKSVWLISIDFDRSWFISIQFDRFQSIFIYGFITSIKKKDFTGKPPAKCQKCSLICCWDCWWKWTNNNESCPQCRSPDPAIIPKMVWCEDENNFITYKTRNHYHIYNGGWVGSPTIKDSLCYPVTESISKLEAY